jgi:hypothetical protein
VDVSLADVSLDMLPASPLLSEDQQLQQHLLLMQGMSSVPPSPLMPSYSFAFHPQQQTQFQQSQSLSSLPPQQQRSQQTINNNNNSGPSSSSSSSGIAHAMSTPSSSQSQPLETANTAIVDENERLKRIIKEVSERVMYSVFVVVLLRTGMVTVAVAIVVVVIVL